MSVDPGGEKPEVRELVELSSEKVKSRSCSESSVQVIVLSVWTIYMSHTIRVSIEVSQNLLEKLHSVTIGIVMTRHEETCSGVQVVPLVIIDGHHGWGQVRSFLIFVQISGVLLLQSVEPFITSSNYGLMVDFSGNYNSEVFSNKGVFLVGF